MSFWSGGSCWGWGEGGWAIGSGGVLQATIGSSHLPDPASPCHLSPTPISALPLGENVTSSEKKAVWNHPTRGVFFAGCRTGSHGAATTTADGRSSTVQDPGPCETEPSCSGRPHAGTACATLFVEPLQNRAKRVSSRPPPA